MAEPEPIDHSISPRTLASMLFANLTTVAGFGLLAFSSVSSIAGHGRHRGAGRHPGADLLRDFCSATQSVIRA